MGSGPSRPECPTALDGDALAGYVTGTLSEAEAEAFEEHFFSCEECWVLVRGAGSVRAAFGADDVVASRADVAAPPRAARVQRRRWSIVLPAAALAAALAGVTLFSADRSDVPPTSGDVFRGVESAIALEAEVESGVLTSRWAPVPGSTSYELRAYDGEGRLMTAVEVRGTSARLDLEASGVDGTVGVASVDVVALDALGQTLRRSSRVILAP